MIAGRTIKRQSLDTCKNRERGVRSLYKHESSTTYHTVPQNVNFEDWESDALSMFERWGQICDRCYPPEEPYPVF